VQERRPYYSVSAFLLFGRQPHHDIGDDKQTGGYDRGEDIEPAANDLDAGVDHPENEQHNKGYLADEEIRRFIPAVHRISGTVY